ncbi:MAG: hypothetical protein GY847_18615 [Proteobacteria bacterium]|nr:hypothetical protein [Pseudomonadota bacterium]
MNGYYLVVAALMFGGCNKTNEIYRSIEPDSRDEHTKNINVAPEDNQNKNVKPKLLPNENAAKNSANVNKHITISLEVNR